MTFDPDNPEALAAEHPLKARLRTRAPRAGVRTQCALAALMWTGAAAALGLRGAGWLLASGLALPLFAVAIFLGFLKSRYLLEGMALRAVERIRERGREACAGGFLSARTWLVVLVMMAGGHALRLTSIPRPWLGTLYCTIATALLLASRHYWRAVRSPSPA